MVPGFGDTYRLACRPVEAQFYTEVELRGKEDTLFMRRGYSGRNRTSLAALAAGKKVVL